MLEEAGGKVTLLQSHNLAGESPGYPCVTDEANCIQRQLIDTIQPLDSGYLDRGVKE